MKLLDLWMGPGYLVTRYDDVRTVLTDPATFSSRSNANGIGLVMGRTILEMDGQRAHPPSRHHRAGLRAQGAAQRSAGAGRRASSTS